MSVYLFHPPLIKASEDRDTLSGDLQQSAQAWRASLPSCLVPATALSVFYHPEAYGEAAFLALIDGKHRWLLEVAKATGLPNLVDNLKKLAIVRVASDFRLFLTPKALIAIEAWSSFTDAGGPDFGQRTITDIPMPEAMLSFLLAQATRPYFLHLPQSHRYVYTSLTTPMYLDICVYDQCRYLFDFAPSADFIPVIQPTDRIRSLRYALGVLHRHIRFVANGIRVICCCVWVFQCSVWFLECFVFFEAIPFLFSQPLT